MLGSWLGWSPREPCPYDGFSVIDAVEREEPSDAVRRHLQDLLRNARFDIGFLRDAANYLGGAACKQE